MKTVTKSDRMFLAAGALGHPDRSVVHSRLKAQMSVCLVATPIWEVLK
jgi:hypothetical protein